MSDETQRLALIRGLTRRLLTGSLDEVRIVDRIWCRLEIGRPLYGPLHLATDKRDWRNERMMETIDRAIYDVAYEIAEEDKARAGLHAASRAEMIDEWNPEQPTVASDAPARIALSDIADARGPYESFDTSDVTTTRGRR